MTQYDPQATATKRDIHMLKQDVGVLKQDVGVLKQDVGVLKEDVSVLVKEMGNLYEFVEERFEKYEERLTQNFLVIAENMRHDYLGAHKDKIQNHENRITRLELHTKIPA